MKILYILYAIYLWVRSLFFFFLFLGFAGMRLFQFLLSDAVFSSEFWMMFLGPLSLVVFLLMKLHRKWLFAVLLIDTVGMLQIASTLAGGREVIYFSLLPSVIVLFVVIFTLLKKK